MKKIFAPLLVVSALVFSLFVSAATIAKSDVIKGKWTLSDEGVYSTVNTNAENGVDEYRVKVADYGDADFILSFSLFAPRGTGEYTAVFFGNYVDGDFYGVGFLLETVGLVIEEHEGASVSVIVPDLTAEIYYETPEGEAAYNDIVVTKNGKVFNVSLNGVSIIEGYEYPDWFAASGGVYYGAFTDSASEKRFTSPDITVPVIPEPESSVPESSAPAEPSAPSEAVSEDVSSLSGKGGASTDDIKPVAFVCLGVIGVVILLAAVFTIISRGKKEK